jgi:hypothetical protein
VPYSPLRLTPPGVPAAVHQARMQKVMEEQFAAQQAELLAKIAALETGKPGFTGASGGAISSARPTSSSSTHAKPPPVAPASPVPQPVAPS